MIACKRNDSFAERAPRYVLHHSDHIIAFRAAAVEDLLAYVDRKPITTAAPRTWAFKAFGRPPETRHSLPSDNGNILPSRRGYLILKASFAHRSISSSMRLRIKVASRS